MASEAISNKPSIVSSAIQEHIKQGNSIANRKAKLIMK
jgi:hypothetical protein